ncbi:AraC-like DNA-binding protein [Chitinophaga skermanii]|uniref:AraC-like DNA-binding protein n=1 Tax=Chitinophaga skermanii TaxID=331697 RepID=A0A327QFC4_9BACT|nr:AraC family transcriptional regulator [Chitinophaga skermanii]RAJ00377.1 AraC-like DNA-binding protein [Chitinophaga skermanii]
MLIENLYQPYEIEVVDCITCLKPVHQHTFFEIVCVLEGTGQQSINDNHFDYNKGHLFLLTPQDVHSFNIYTPTKLFFLRFNDVYIKSQLNPAAANDFMKRLEFILYNGKRTPGCILSHKSDRLLVYTLVESVVREMAQKPLHHEAITAQLVNMIIAIVARNVSVSLNGDTQVVTNEAHALDIIQYVQEHIYEPAKLRAAPLSKHFGISIHYLGRYFKKHTGQNLQQYITQYKLKLVETRLKHSDLRVNEIAFELNFTDESHLNRIFKKYKGMSPTEYRKSRREVQLAIA